jgi:hypothetical protein
MTQDQEKRAQAIALLKKLRNLAENVEGPERDSARLRITEIMAKHNITEDDLVEAPEPTTPPSAWDWGTLLYQLGMTPEEVERMLHTTVEDFLVSTKWFEKKTIITQKVTDGVIKAGKIGASRLAARFFLQKK